MIILILSVYNFSIKNIYNWNKPSQESRDESLLQWMQNPVLLSENHIF